MLWNRELTALGGGGARLYIHEREPVAPVIQLVTSKPSDVGT